MPIDRTAAGIAYERSRPDSAAPTVVLVHAGIADRRMWDPAWGPLTDHYDLVRLDLRGFGDSERPPDGSLDHVADLLATLDDLGVDRAHLVGSSYGAGVVVETVLTRPALAQSLLLAPPGGSLLAELTDDLQTFFDAERTALANDDLEAAVEANVDSWVVGNGRRADDVEPEVVEAVRTMQRRAFEVTGGWPSDPDEVELDPPALDRLHEISVPALVLVGGHDLATTHDAAGRLEVGIGGCRRVDWSDVAHLPSLERPGDFVTLLREFVDAAG